MPFGNRTGRCAAGPVPERRATGAVVFGLLLARARASRGTGATCTAAGSREMTRPCVTAARSIAPTRGEGGRSAFVGRGVVALVAGQPTGGGDGRLGRHRRHQSPARDHVVKVLYGPAERAVVEQAADLAGLRPSSYVAWAAVTMAEQVLGQPSDAPGGESAGVMQGVWSVPGERELLAELMQARLALRRFGVNLNQAVAALHSGAPAPAWLEQAVAGGHRAVARIDTAAAAVARRLV